MKSTWLVYGVYFHYNIDNILLKRSDTINDLAAYRAYGYILRNCRNLSNVSALMSLYLNLVISKLEYDSLIWNPICFQYTSDIEKVQRKFLEFLSFKVNGFYFVSSEIPRYHASVIFLYKLINGKIDCYVLLVEIDILVPRIVSTYNTTFLCKRVRTRLMFKAPTL